MSLLFNFGGKKVGKKRGEGSESETRIVYKVNLFKFDYRNFRGTFFIFMFQYVQGLLIFLFLFAAVATVQGTHLNISETFPLYPGESNINRTRAFFSWPTFLIPCRGSGTETKDLQCATICGKNSAVRLLSSHDLIHNCTIALWLFKRAYICALDYGAHYKKILGIYQGYYIVEIPNILRQFEIQFANTILPYFFTISKSVYLT